MNTIQLIKKHLPQVHNKDRKRFEVVLEVKAKQNKTTVLEEINVLKEQYANQKKEDSKLLLHKILATGLLIETNDSLEGTTLDGYHCNITSQVGKKFMNAQYKLYNNEYSNLTKHQDQNANHILSQVERALCVLSNAIQKDYDSILDVCELMQNDKVFAKRIQGIYKQHLKQNPRNNI